MKLAHSYYNLGDYYNAKINYNKVFKIRSNTIPGLISKEEYVLETDMMLEELQEYREANSNNDLVEVVDAIADQLYLAIGMVEKHGLQDIMEEIMDEVHRSNMSKVWEDGTIHKNDAGKVMKPSHFSPPRIKEILDNYLRKEANRTKLDV